MSADQTCSTPSSSTSFPSFPSSSKPLRSNQYNLNSPRVPFRDAPDRWALPPPKAEPKPRLNMQSTSQQEHSRQDPTSSPESKQRFRVPSSSNAFNTIRSTLVALSDATAPAPRSKSKPRAKATADDDEDLLSLAYGLEEPPNLSYDAYTSPPPSYEEVCFTSVNGIGSSNHLLPRQDISSTADTIRSIARKVRKELVNGGR